MKVLVILLVLIGFVGIASAFPGFSSQKIYDFSDVIVVGKVTFVNSTFSPTANLYHIQVEKFLKNPQDSNEILAAGSKSTSVRAGNEIFGVGDRALFFLTEDFARMYPKYSGIYEVSTVSQKMKPNWDECNIFEKNIPPDHWVFGGRNNHLYVSQDNKTDEFVTDKKITISYDVFNHEPVTKKVDFRMTVRNTDEHESLYEFTETEYRILEPCTVYETISWSFTLSEPATYFAEFTDLKGHTTGLTIPVKSSYPLVMTPLKQTTSGIPSDEIQCKEDLVLIQKYDGSPACVTESTKTTLIERGWTKSLPPCTSDRTACFNQESNMCDPSGWDCGNEEVFSKVIPMPEPVYVIFPQNATGNSPDSGVIPHVSVITLGINDTITWINDSDRTVILRAKDNSWNAGKILPQGKIDVKFNHTGQYEYLIDILKDKRRSGGEVIVLGENIDSISIDERLRMAQAILGQHFRELSIVSVGAGNADKILDVTIHEDELEKHQDAESYYKNTVEQIIPFDVPIRIDFERYSTPD